jgi:hypothetical protein
VGAGEADALSQMRAAEAGLREYAERNGLVMRLELPWPGAMPPEQQPGPIKHAAWSLAGVFPGGAVGRLRHQSVYGSTFGMKVGGHHTIMVCRLPESVGYVPMLCCRPAELGTGLYYWGGDQRKRQSKTFESVELERRYEVELAPGQSQQWLYQLFSPSFIDWLAHETPPDFGFKLDLGVFTCELPQWRGGAGPELDTDHLDALSAIGGRVAGRIRDEVLEEAGLRGAAQEVDSAEAYAAWANAPKHGRIVGSLMWAIGKLPGSEGPDASTREFATQRGLEMESPAHFHARYIGLAMPGAAVSAATGRVPGLDREGSVAWLEYTSEVDMQHDYVAVATPSQARLPARWVDEADLGVPGFSEGLPDAALEAAAAAGCGISTSPHAVCVYLRTEGTTPRERVDAFLETAAGIVRLLEGSPPLR